MLCCQNRMCFKDALRTPQENSATKVVIKKYCYFTLQTKELVVCVSGRVVFLCSKHGVLLICLCSPVKELSQPRITVTGFWRHK